MEDNAYEENRKLEFHSPGNEMFLEIFTKNVKEWPIEILNVNRKCLIIKILILTTVIDCTEVFIETPSSQ
jgi:hypothetical protein